MSRVAVGVAQLAAVVIVTGQLAGYGDGDWCGGHLWVVIAGDEAPQIAESVPLASNERYQGRPRFNTAVAVGNDPANTILHRGTPPRPAINAPGPVRVNHCAGVRITDRT